MPIEKRWVVKAQGNRASVESLSAALGMPTQLTNLLVQRGIDTVEKARKFFSPSLRDLHDPFLMKDMDKAVERLHQAITQGEKILIYGDYDVDGTTAVAVMYRFLSPLSSHIDYYIPDRYNEGYGVSTQGIDYAAEQGCSLIITLDCGIKAVEKVAYANSKGIDVIVCDHHTPGETLPDAGAVLKMTRSDCP